MIESSLDRAEFLETVRPSILCRRGGRLDDQESSQTQEYERSEDGTGRRVGEIVLPRGDGGRHDEHRHDKDTDNPPTGSARVRHEEEAEGGEDRVEAREAIRR